MTTTIGSTESTALPSSSGTSGNPKKAPRKGNRAKRFVLVGAVVLVLGGAWAGDSLLNPRGSAATSTDSFVVAPRDFKVTIKEKGELKAAKSADIICEVEGRTTIISLVDEGTAVKKGDLLVELASDKINERIATEELKEANAITTYESAKSELDIQRDKNASDIRKAELEIELKKLALDRYQEGDWVQQLKDVDVSIEQARIMLKRREEDWAAAQNLYERKFITRTKYQEDQFNFQKAQWDLDRAKMTKEVLVQYTHVGELRKRESDYDEAIKEADRAKKKAAAEETKKLRGLEGADKELSLIRDQLAKLRLQKEKCKIYAPTQGFVVYYGGGGRFYMMSEPIKEGGEVHERQVLMQLPDTTAMVSVVRVNEAKTDKLSLGQSAIVTVEGVPGRQFTGKVTKIAVLADTQNRWLNPDLKEYETEISLDPTDFPLKPGVTSHVEILFETVKHRLAVPVQSIFSKGGRRYAMRRNGDGTEPVPVRLGSIGTQWVEVVDGLSENDVVLLAVSEAQKRLIPDGPGQPNGHEKESGASRQASSDHKQTATHTQEKADVHVDQDDKKTERTTKEDQLKQGQDGTGQAGTR